MTEAEGTGNESNDKGAIDDGKAVEADASSQDKTAKDERGKTSDDGKQVSASEKKAAPESIKANKQGWVQQKIGHYAQETRATREELKRVQAELEQLKAGSSKPALDRDAQPQSENYERYQDYIDALVDWKVAQKDKVARQETSQRQMHDNQQREHGEFDARLRAYAMQYDDPEAVYNAITREDIPITEPMAAAIRKLGAKGPDVAFHLAQNPHEAMRIASLDPMESVFEIAFLSKSLSGSVGAQPHSNGRPEPKAVPSIRGAAPSDDMSGAPSDKDDAVTWARKEAARVRARFGPNVRVYQPRG